MTSPSSRYPEPRPSDRVASLFDAAAARGVGPVPGEEEALAAFRSDGPKPVRMIRGRSFAAALAASATTAVLVTGGVAAAVPGPVSDAARATAGQVLRTIGIDVPAAGPSRDARAHRDGGSKMATAGTSPAQGVVGSDSPDQSQLRNDGDLTDPSTTQRGGVEPRGDVSKRTILAGAGVVEENGEVSPSATPTETGAVDPEGEEVSPSATPTETGAVDPEGEEVSPSATPTETGAVDPEGEEVSPSATPTDTVGAEPEDGDVPISATAAQTAVVEESADASAPTTAPDSVGVEEDGEISPSPSPGESQTRKQDHASVQHGRADERRPGDVGRTSKAGGPGDVGDNGSSVGTGISTERDDLGLRAAAPAGNGRAATGRRHRH